MRLFIALEIEAAVRQRLHQAQQRLQELAPGVKWVPPSNFHITLQFVGEGCPDEIETRMRRAVVGVGPMVLELAGLGSFPRGAIWAGVKAPEALAKMAHELGYTANFHPHVTLGRARGRVDLVLDGDLEFGTSEVKEIVLMSSLLTAHGSIYSVERRVALSL